MPSARLYVDRIFIDNDGDAGLKGAGDFLFVMNVTHNGRHDGNDPVIELNDEVFRINTGQTWQANKFFDTNLPSPLDIRFVVQEKDDGTDDWADVTKTGISPYNSGSYSVSATQEGGKMRATIHFRVEFFPRSVEQGLAKHKDASAVQMHRICRRPEMAGRQYRER